MLSRLVLMAMFIGMSFRWRGDLDAEDDVVRVHSGVDVGGCVVVVVVRRPWCGQRQVQSSSDVTAGQ